ncbi:MAG: hypothetical protein IT378_25655 [Sandaracinaceae bacterium]|nr:hypothetical protein [Sandaracinaceae bacterium]
MQAALDVEGGRLEEAKTRLLPLSNDTTDSATRSALGGLLAWCELFISDAALNDADMRSQQALSIEGSHIAYGARGAVLAKLGRAGEAVEHLRISLEHAPNDEWEAHFTAWLALAEARLGRQAEANRLLGIASDLDPRCYSLPRVRAELCHEREVEDA